MEEMNQVGGESMQKVARSTADNETSDKDNEEGREDESEASDGKY